MMNFNQALGEKIRNIRKSKGISQELMSEKLFITQSSYAKIENGQTILSVNRLFVIADSFKIEPSLLIPNSSNFESKDVLVLNKDLDVIQFVQNRLNEKNLLIEDLKNQLENR
jgi:transcriptional regulator with XRE-family HTH domain